MAGYSHLFQNFPQFIVIHTVKGFGIVNKAEIDVFLELSCFFHDPVDVGNLLSGSSAFSKTSLNIRKFTVHILLNGQPSKVFLPREFHGQWNLECYRPWGCKELDKTEQLIHIPHYTSIVFINILSLKAHSKMSRGYCYFHFTEEGVDIDLFKLRY